MEASSSRTTRARGTAAEELPMSTPKRSKKTVPPPPANLPELQSGEPANAVQDDAKSVRSHVASQGSATSSARRRRDLEAEREANRRLLEVDKRLAEKERQSILKDLEIAKSINAQDEQEGEEDEVAVRPRLPLPEVPQAEKTDAIKKWVTSEPLAQAEHPYARTEFEMMNERIEKLLARQTVSRDLPRFSGEADEWFAFITQYEQTTSLCGLSNNENLIRLSKCLNGKAREAVAPLLTIPENVPQVMSTLKMLFGRPQQIIKSLLEKTRNLPSVNESQPESIITFAHSVNNLVATMKNLKQLGHLSNPALLEELLSKLPPSLQLQWCLNKKDDDDNLEKLAEWLMRVAKAATSMPISTKLQNHKSSDNTRSTKRQVLNANDGSQANFKSNCPRCSESHLLYKCNQFKADSIDARWNLVGEKKLCFSCLRPGHLTGNCQNRRTCGMNGCKLPHNALLHRDKSAPAPARTNYCGTTKEVSLRVIPVKLNGPNGTTTIHALMDDGSTVTMLDQSVALQLGLSGPKQSLCIEWTNKMIQTEPNSETVSCKISGVGDRSREFKLRNIRTVSSLDLPSHSVDAADLKSKWSHLSKIPLQSFQKAKPSLIIGQDNILLIISRKVRHGKWDEPVASKTWLGWSVHGHMPYPHRVDRVLIHHICEDKADQELCKLVQKSLTDELFGVTEQKNKILSQQDQRGLEILEATVKRNGSQFEAGLLWASDKIEMPTASKQTALRRLYCMERKMDKDPDFAKMYCEKINEYIQKGYATKLNFDEAKMVSLKSFYIPHFAVTNPNKPGKLRLVFDAAAKTEGTSLNSALISGPDLLNDLPAVLWRFRQHPIGFTSDIAEMFHRVTIRSADRDAQRFLWRGTDRDKAPQTYVMNAMIFGATCSPTTAIYVMNKNAEEFASEYPEVARAVARNFYVDDYCDGADTEEEALAKIQGMIEVQRRGGFHIRNWICSSPNVVSELPEELLTNSLKELKNDLLLPTERVLGLWWDSQRDFLKFRLNDAKLILINDASKKWTKRQILKLTASIFDPIGLLAQFLIKARIIFQSVWRSTAQWDDPLCATILTEWESWVKQLPAIQNVSIPRFYGVTPRSLGPVLHVFADASTEAYSAVAYFRWGGEECSGISFVAAKARVAPLKPMTVPRLELTAALLAVRLATTIRKEHDYGIVNTVFWSDSRITLAWIRSDPAKFKQFVAARVCEIQELSNVDQWRWVPTADNPADDATRLSAEISLSHSARWYTGPSFLADPPSSWPTEMHSEPVPALVSEERAKFVGVIDVPDDDDSMPDLTRFSSWIKLIRTTAWVVRIARNFKYSPKVLTDLTVFEIDDAERRWIRKVQAESFPAEVASLKSSKPIDKSSRLYSLLPFLDEHNIMRVRGRTEYSNLLEYDTKHPVILDGKHDWTRLLVTWYHVKALHMGIERVINDLRAKYWITSMRLTVKLIARSCQLCKNLHARPLQPMMAPLPDHRVNSKFVPFDHVGLDFCGPFEVKTSVRGTQKRYIALFTCLSVRAVHLEIVSSMTTESTIMAIRRFLCRRGVYPSHYYTDCYSSFRGASKEIRDAIRALDRERLAEEFAAKPVTWHFSPPSAPNFGGAWERLVRSVKAGLDVTMRSRRPNIDVFETLVTEIEYSVNSRPLTDVSVDPKDLRSLTPNDFLHTNNVRVPNWTKPNERPTLRKIWRTSQALANVFWQRWIKEYLPTLTRRNKWHAAQPEMKLGDVVLIADGQLSRNSWPMGTITQLYPGRDGVVRVVDVRTTAGTYRRPVSKLAKLDVRTNEEE